MSNRRLLLAAAAVGVFGLAAPAQAWTWGFNEQVKGSGEVVSETRDLGTFDAISLSGSYKVLVRQGSAVKLEIKADKNLLPLIETRVVEGSKGRTLEIGSKKGFSFSSKSDPQITLVLPLLRSIAIAGSGDMRVETMKTPDVSVSVSGSGDVEFVDLSSDSLSVQVSGSGDIKARGRVAKFSLAVAGSGDIDARDLQAEEVKASIAGSGNATVHAVNTLKISIAGSGDIAYLGSPKVSSSVAGRGVITKLN
jgi:hypothetical protein